MSNLISIILPISYKFDNELSKKIIDVDFLDKHFLYETYFNKIVLNPAKEIHEEAVRLIMHELEDWADATTCGLVELYLDMLYIKYLNNIDPLLIKVRNNILQNSISFNKGGYLCLKVKM